MGQDYTHIEEIKQDIKMQNDMLEQYHKEHVKTNKLILQSHKYIEDQNRKLNETNKRILLIEKVYNNCRDDIQGLKDNHDRMELHKKEVLTALKILNKDIVN